MRVSVSTLELLAKMFGRNSRPAHMLSAVVRVIHPVYDSFMEYGMVICNYDQP